MGKINFTVPQKAFLSLIVSERYFPTTFYLTGGTALSAFYYDHRLSEDIDLFSTLPFDQELVRNWMNEQKKRHHWQLKYVQVLERQTYEIVTKRSTLKVDFVHYPHRRLETSSINYEGLSIDSKADIAVNKLLTVSQRTTTKDFVDLYFLLQKDFTWWDLMQSVEHKFGIEIDKFYLSSLLSKIDSLDTLPIMKKKLTLEELKTFFLSEAKKLAITMVKP